MQPSVQVKVDVGGQDKIPHTFLKVTHPDGASSDCGLSPEVHGSLTGEGKIYETGTTGADGIYIPPHEYQLRVRIGSLQILNIEI